MHETDITDYLLKKVANTVKHNFDESEGSDLTNLVRTKMGALESQRSLSVMILKNCRSFPASEAILYRSSGSHPTGETNAATVKRRVAGWVCQIFSASGGHRC